MVIKDNLEPILDFLRNNPIKEGHMCIAVLIDRGSSSHQKKRIKNIWVVQNEEDITKCLFEAVPVMKASKDDLRLYINLDSRSIEEVHKNVFSTFVYDYSFLTKLRYKLLKCFTLVNPLHKYKLIDIDNPNLLEEVRDKILSNKGIIYLQLNSKKGIHLITNRFDRRCIDEIKDVEYKKECLTLLAYKE